MVSRTREIADARAREAQARLGRDALDRMAVLTLMVGALCLFGGRFTQDAFPDRWNRFTELCAWGATQIVFYAVVPLALARPLLGLSWSELGLRARGTHPRPYVALFAVAAPVVVAASFTAAFQAKYPFLPLSPSDTLWPRMFVWWAVYAVQFFAIEVFFRGFLLQGLLPRMGYMAVFVMIVPYCMLHFTKPPLEALAAIVGGFVLGTLALRTRSIVWGVALHCSIAGLMDAAALAHKGRLW